MEEWWCIYRDLKGWGLIKSERIGLIIKNGGECQCIEYYSQQDLGCKYIKI